MSYIFYFEINSNNINQICSKLPFSKNGQDLIGQTQ